MKITDGKKTVNIEMKVWQGNGYSPDWSIDFFNAGSLKYNDEIDIYIVDDVDYCIEQAQDWKNSIGDYSMDKFNNNNEIFVEEI